MEKQNNTAVALSEEQLDALAQSLLPSMRDFFKSESGKKIWEEHLKEISQANGKAA